MSHPYDASTKYLVEVRLADWLPLCGRPSKAPLEIVDADVSTVTAMADRVLHVADDPAWLMHLELQASRDADLPANVHVYNAVLERRHRLAVRSVVVLLRREADAPFLTGVLQRGFAGEDPYLTFRYDVVRIWQMPVEAFLNGGLGILPLAPLSNVIEAQLPAVVQRINERLRREATQEEAGRLWTATDVLMGLRYPEALVEQILEGVQAMEESVTYQAIVRKGEVRALQQVVLEQGQDRFGPPEESIKRTVLSIKDVPRLQAMTRRLLHVGGWAELLAEV